MKGKCWNCGKLNEMRADGYFLCDCKNIPENSSGGLFYLPIEVHNDRKERAKIENLKPFLDDEESKI